MRWLCPAPVAEKDLEGQGAAQYGSKGALLDPQVWPGLNTQFPALCLDLGVPRPGFCSLGTRMQPMLQVGACLWAG